MDETRYFTDLDLEQIQQLLAWESRSKSDQVAGFYKQLHASPQDIPNLPGSRSRLAEPYPITG
jgi:hypothetical protein